MPGDNHLQKQGLHIQVKILFNSFFPYQSIVLRKQKALDKINTSSGSLRIQRFSAQVSYASHSDIHMNLHNILFLEGFLFVRIYAIGIFLLTPPHNYLTI